MKCSWIAVPPFAFLMLVFSSCVSSSRFEEGKSCRVVRGEDNRTYTEVTWCDHGCCRDDQQREKCCDGSTLTSGMVFGFVITGSLVVLAFCIYVRLRVATSTAKPTRPSPAAENEAAPEVSIPEEDPPPPYWICMSQDPPQYDQAVSSFLHSDGIRTSRVVAFSIFGQWFEHRQQ
ncbi:uncharacterized protein LOC143284479 isoform X2 [Babylonia areolata]|uniref:uncharacterized protein LOC143284479 isoform X2 n=1 Tax=Babylonia areolata TaxID=304850 RepID=UPI003FD39E40